MDPDGVAHGHEAAAVVQRAQGGLGQLAAHRVDHDVGAAGQGIAQRLAQVAGAVVDQPLGATGPGRLELLGCRGDRRHRRAEGRAELHRGRPDAPAGAEHNELLTWLQGRHRAQHVVRRLVGHAEGGRHAVVDLGGDRRDRPGADDHLFGEGPDEARAEDALADRPRS